MKPILLALILSMAIGISSAMAQAIQHDAEHYVLLHQYADKWAAEDKELDQKLAEIRQKNDGKVPNIVYILIDDMGFGEFGMPELNRIRDGRRGSRSFRAKNNDLLQVSVFVYLQGTIFRARPG